MSKTRAQWCANVASLLTWRISQAVPRMTGRPEYLPIESCGLMCPDLCRGISAQNRMFSAMWLCEESTRLQ